MTFIDSLYNNDWKFNQTGLQNIFILYIMEYSEGACWLLPCKQ